MNHTLSKSDFMLYLKHPAWLWVKKYQKYMIPAVSESTQNTFDEGHYFEEMVEKLFPDAIKLGFNGFKEYEELVFKTNEALTNHQTILQGRFEFQNLTCIVDALLKLETGSFKLIEIKSSSGLKPEHEYDLAFQLNVLRALGIDIGQVSIIHVNSDYVKHGEVNPQELSLEVDVTARVEELQPFIQTQISKALHVLKEKQIPDISFKYFNQHQISQISGFSDWVEIYQKYRPTSDPYSIFNLTHIDLPKYIELESRKIFLIKDIPLDLNLSSRQLAQVLSTISRERKVMKESLSDFLQTFTFPLYFFDYETLASSVPFFDGMSPYKDYPFQYSLHVMETPNSEASHFEFLHLENSDPTISLIQSMKSHIGEQGTILSWYKQYETSCNTRLASMYPEHAEFLENLNERTIDLMTPFSESWVSDYRFLGSSSIKKVLPILVPELNYQELDIGNGLKARKMWIDTFLEGKNAESKGKIIEDLKKYCTLDTWAMVRIYQELLKLV